MKFLKHPATLFSIYMALIGGSYLPYFAFLPIRVSYHVIVTGVLIYWIWKEGLPSTPLLWPLAITAALSFISAINSIDPRISLEAWWHMLTNGLLGLMLIHWMRREWGETLFKTHFGIAGLVAIVSGLEFLVTGGQRVGGPFGLINLTGAYAAVLLLPALVWAWKERKAWIMAVGVGLVAVLLMNDSRGAFISAGVALSAFLVLRFHVRWKALLVAGAIITGLVFGIASKTSGGHAFGDVIRQDLWRSALAMLKDHPLTGVGPGVFGQAFRSYRTVTDDNMSGAHDWYLNTLAELGIPGGVAAALSALVFVRALPRKRTAKQDAILAALVGVGAHLLFDNFPAVNFVFLVNLYVAYLMAGKHQKRALQGRAVLEAAAATMLITFALFLAIFDTAQSYYEQSIQENSIADARIASTIDPGMRIYSIQVARLEGNVGRVQQIDPSISESTNWQWYSLINFGRFLW
ncbi:MAG TPA: O-antigen ligase family protein [Terriglobales bacterium]|nr:O-antigen ligase family protein [Terriglobales bacterium]